MKRRICTETLRLQSVRDQAICGFIRLQAARLIVGDVEYGYVSRGLKSRHIQFIALGGTVCVQPATFYIMMIERTNPNSQ